MSNLLQTLKMNYDLSKSYLEEKNIANSIFVMVCTLYTAYQTISDYIITLSVILVDKPNILKMRTLIRSCYIDNDQKMLHAIFTIIADHIEIEYAKLNDDKSTIWSNKRNRESGLEYLDAIINDNPTDYRFKKLKQLYIWWKDVYPQRENTYDTVERINGSVSSQEHFDQLGDLDEFYKLEEQVMLLKAIQIRPILWT